MAAKRGRKAKEPAPAAPVAGKVGPKVAPAATIPDPPGHLEGLEVDAWRGACAALAARSALDSADLAIVEQFAVSYAIGRRLRDELRGAALTTSCKMSGRTYVNPLIALQSDNGAKVRALLAELGLTPRSRKLPAGGPSEPDAFDVFMAGK